MEADLEVDLEVDTVTKYSFLKVPENRNRS